MTVLGVGTDLVDISRISASVERRSAAFAARILTEREMVIYQESSRPDFYLAKCFALKEAVSKALGTGMSGGVSWHTIECDRHKSGQPFVRLSQGAAEKLMQLGGQSVHVSLSDEAGYVTAFAVISA